MDVVELGGIRLHLLPVHPGLPHEADRVARELTRLAPAVVLADVGTDDALRMREALASKKPYEPGFVDGLLANATHARYGGDNKRGEDPLLTAARHARDRRAEFIPLRTLAKRPGLFARRRARKAVERLDALPHETFPAAFTNALAHEWDPAPEVEAAHARLVRALREGRAPIVAVLQAHRYATYLDALRQTGRIPA